MAGILPAKQLLFKNNPEEFIRNVIKIIREQNALQVREMINLLPADQKEVLILRHYADLSFKEIAEMTGTNINTALGRMRYALLNLRKMMGNQVIVQ